MRISLFASVKDTSPRVVDVTWEQLAQALTQHTFAEDKLSARLWSPTDYEDGDTRADENVTALTAFVADLDHVTNAQLDAIDLEPHAFILHSTYSPDSYRLVMPFSREVTPQEFPAIRANIIRHFNLPADPKTDNFSRLYFEPTARPNTTPVAISSPGEALNVDRFTNTARGDDPASRETHRSDLGAETEDSGSRAADRDPGNTDSTAPIVVVDLSDAKAFLKRVRNPDTKPIAQRILAGEPLAQQGERDHTTNRAAGLIAMGTTLPVEAAIALIRPSLAAMPVEPEGLEAWISKFSYCFKRARERKAEDEAKRAVDRAQNEALRAEIEARNQELQARIFTPDNPLSALEVRTNKDGDIRILPTASNAGLLLEHSDEWRGVIRFNLFTNEVEFFGGPCLDSPPATRHIDVSNWLARSDYNINVTPPTVFDQILAIARRHAYDPYQDYLNAQVWDGTPRLETFLETYAGVAVTEDIQEYVRSVSAKFLISAVARALKPGCKVDNVLVLEGDQGTRKSTLLATLAGPFFLDQKITIGDKDSQQLINRAGLVELGEMAAIRKSDTEMRKAFLSRTVDIFRPPYGRVAEEFPRRCIFVGTTNNADYMDDPTGNRRYWPVRCGKIDIEALKRDRDQIWAEAVHRYKSGETWWLEAELYQKAAEQVEERTFTNVGAWGEIIRKYYEKEASAPTETTASEVAAMIICLQPRDINASAIKQITMALRALGFTPTKKRHGPDRKPSNVWTAPPGFGRHLKSVKP